MSTEIEIATKYAIGSAVNFANTAREELGDLFVPEFPRVKMPSGGSLTWEVPGADPERPETVSEIEGVIVALRPNSRTYLTKFEDRDADSGGSPDFYSTDGKTQIITEEGLRKIAEINAAGGRDGKQLPQPSPILAQCPYNQFGSAWMANKKGNAKATNEYLSVYLHTGGGALFPLEIGLTSTNIENFKRFVSSQIIGQTMSLADTLVVFGLKKEKSTGNIDYSKATFRTGERLDASLAAEYREFSQGIKAIITQDPFARVEQPQAADVVDVAPVQTPEPVGVGSTDDLDL